MNAIGGGGFPLCATARSRASCVSLEFGHGPGLREGPHSCFPASGGGRRDERAAWWSMSARMRARNGPVYRYVRLSLLDRSSKAMPGMPLLNSGRLRCERLQVNDSGSALLSGLWAHLCVGSALPCTLKPSSPICFRRAPAIAYRTHPRRAKRTRGHDSLTLSGLKSHCSAGARRAQA